MFVILPMLAGQFFRDGVDIDVETQFLHVPDRPPVPVQEKDLWKFMEESFQKDTKCWTSAYHSSQGAGIVAGTYTRTTLLMTFSLLSTELDMIVGPKC